MRLIDADQAASIENLDQYSDLAAALGDMQTVRDIFFCLWLFFLLLFLPLVLRRWLLQKNKRTSAVGASSRFVL